MKGKERERERINEVKPPQALKDQMRLKIICQNRISLINDCDQNVLCYFRVSLNWKCT